MKFMYVLLVLALVFYVHSELTDITTPDVEGLVESGDVVDRPARHAYWRRPTFYRRPKFYSPVYAYRRPFYNRWG